MKYSFLPLFIIIFSIISCGKEKFATKKVGNTYNAPLTEFMKFEGKGLSAYGTVPPKVDFLFIWDNSSSFLLNSDATKDALAGTISQISKKFDYRIILSPLIPTKKTREEYLLESWIVSKTSDYLGNLFTRWLPVDEGYWATFNIAKSGSLEAGIDRAYDLTSLGFEKGIFREKAHMIIVILSNGDDNSWWRGVYSGPAQQNHVDTRADKFAELKNLQKSLSLKFLSVVPHTECQGSKLGITYKMMSAKFSSSQTGDSYDFCNIQSFYRLFDEINTAITEVRIPYTYQYWPITTDQYGKVDPNEVKVIVRKETGEKIKDLYKDNPDGWSFYAGNPVESPKSLMIINCPTKPDGQHYPEINCEKERYSGYFIQLNGKGQITWPNYIDVSTQTQLEYFGYVKLNFKPYIDPNKKLSDSIRVKRNGFQIPEGGFEYIPERTTRNIKIKGPDTPPVDFTEGEDPKREFEGYFLKLAPNWVYKSNDSVQVDYWPAGK